MEKDSVKKAELVKEAEIVKEAAEIKIALELKKDIEEGRYVDITKLDINKLVSAFNDIKRQNEVLFNTIKTLDPHDKHFEQKKNVLYRVADELRFSTEKQLRQLRDFVETIKDNAVDMKLMKSIASVNKPSKESIKYGQTFIGLRKSFLDMAVKRASDKTNNSDSTKGND